MFVVCVATVWVVNASRNEKSCLQFLILTGSGAGGEGGVSHHLKSNFRFFFFVRFSNVYRNSRLRVKRRKGGNAQRASSSSHEAEGDRELSSAGMTARLTVPDNFQSRSPSAKCCELYASLHDRFRLEVRILFYPMRTLKLAV